MSIPTFSQQGKVAVITGSRRGLGKAMALAFAEAGADVVISDVVVGDGELEATAKEIRSFGGRALAMKTDVTKKADVDILVAKVITEFGRIDVLINNAGITGAPDITQLSDEDRKQLAERRLIRRALLDSIEDTFDRVMSTHLKGSLLCSQAAAGKMIEQKRGCIINLSSMNAYAKSGSAYNIAKASIVSLTKGLAWELGPHGIRVNAIAPGVIRTDMTRQIWENPLVLQDIVGKTPLGRIGEPDDIAHMALFLASDAARFITGQTILVDGGIVPIG